MNIVHLSIEYPKQNSFVSGANHNIYVCTNPPKAAILNNTAIKIPRGRFDINEILAQLNVQPDLISVSSSLAILGDAPLPQGISQLRVPSVMKFTDSHHMHNPIRKLIEYAKSVDCHYHWTTYNRNHIHFYKEAGLKNVFWMPGSISIPYFEPKKVPITQAVGFCGTLEGDHPVRKEYLMFLKSQGVDVSIARKSYRESLEFYHASQIAFNCSLNGDVNRRVFEVLMAQGFLLTDRLSIQSGLFTLFKEGVHLECYSSKDELLQKVRYYLEHPRKAREIADQGHQLFVDEYHPDVVNNQFYNIVLGLEAVNDKFVRIDDRRIRKSRSEYDQNLKMRICMYELIQEIHRINMHLKVFLSVSNLDIASDLADLPRLELGLYCRQESAGQITHHLQAAGVGDRVRLFHHFPEKEFDIVITDEIANGDQEQFSRMIKSAALWIVPVKRKGDGALRRLLATLAFAHTNVVEPASSKIMGNEFYAVFKNRNPLTGRQPIRLRDVAGGKVSLLLREGVLSGKKIIKKIFKLLNR